MQEGNTWYDCHGDCENPCGGALCWVDSVEEQEEKQSKMSLLGFAATQDGNHICAKWLLVSTEKPFSLFVVIGCVTQERAP